MNRDWMYEYRGESYEIHLQEFLNCAQEHQRKTNAEKIACPCRDCTLVKKFKSIHEIRFHLRTRGFMSHYKRWTMHGESDVDNHVSCSINDQRKRCRTETIMDTTNDCHDIPSDSGIYDTSEHADQMSEMLSDIQEHLADRPSENQHLLDASRKPLFPGSEYTKLTATLNLFNLKGKYGWSDKSFTALLDLLHDILPDGNDLPTTTYEAKKLMCPMGTNYEKIHACPNNCVLYRGDYVHLDQCPKCSLPRGETLVIDCLLHGKSTSFVLQFY